MNNSINVLFEAKKEYTTELQKILTPRLYEGFKSIYDDIIDMVSKELEQTKKQNSSIVKTFQKMLKEIPQWNQDMVKNEYNRIEQLSNCDYFDNLIEAVFITNTKILTSVQINDLKSKNVKINIPQPSYFVHRCYIECAKEIYKNPYIFDNSKGLTPKEKHTNLRESINIIENSIDNAVRNLLPIRDILKHGLTKNSSNTEESQEEESNENEESSEEESPEEESHKKTQELHEEDKELPEEDENSTEDTTEDSTEDDVNDEVNDELNKDLTDEKSEEKVENKNLDISESKSIDNNFPLASLAAPKLISSNSIELDKSNSLDESIPEVKEILYSTKLEPTFPKRLETIEKMDEQSQTNITKISLPKNNTEQYNFVPNNQFIKRVNISKFIKNKKSGGDNSFYKKKYEENSANYQYVSDQNNDKNITAVSDITMVSEASSVPTIDTRMVQKYKEEVKNVDLRNISKNKIILDGVSEDDEEDEDELEL